MLIDVLAPGELDIVGDVHGEVGVLRVLLEGLGYAADGSHPQGRRLVFVGDLVDRGPDSPAVVRLVADMVAKNNAQCVLGNHELNILRRSEKADNAWFFSEADSGTQKEILGFLGRLPLALERPGLRVVHACWDERSVRAVRNQPGDAMAIFGACETDIAARLQEEGLLQEAAGERTRYPLHDRASPPPEMLHALAAADVREQIENPVKVLTSGIERVADAPFWANGKWRFVQRVPWWETYAGQSIVVVGHYWRSRDPVAAMVESEAGLFGNTGPRELLGPHKRVMCIDYSIGLRHRERLDPTNAGTYRSALAAYRIHNDREPEIFFAPG